MGSFLNNSDWSARGIIDNLLASARRRSTRVPNDKAETRGSDTDGRSDAQKKADKAAVRPEASTDESQWIDGYSIYKLRDQISSAASSLSMFANLAAQFGEVPRLPHPGADDDVNDVEYQNDERDDINEVIVSRAIESAIESGEKTLDKRDLFRKFFETKTVQPTNLFIAGFSAHNHLKKSTQKYYNGDAYGDDAPGQSVLPVIMPWHIKQVSFKTVTSDVQVEYGAGTFPIPYVDHDDIKHQFSVTFQDDYKGTVYTWIQTAYALIANNGYVNNDRLSQSVGSFLLTQLNDKYTAFIDVRYDDVFLISAGDMDFSYTNGDIREYSCTFGATGKVITTTKVETNTEMSTKNDRRALQLSAEPEALFAPVLSNEEV